MIDFGLRIVIKVQLIFGRAREPSTAHIKRNI